MSSSALLSDVQVAKSFPCQISPLCMILLYVLTLNLVERAPNRGVFESTLNGEDVLLSWPPEDDMLLSHYDMLLSHSDMLLSHYDMLLSHRDMLLSHHYRSHVTSSLSHRMEHHYWKTFR